MKGCAFTYSFFCQGEYFMEWKEIQVAIKEIALKIREDCIINNTAIRDDIFGILEEKCTVIYYPLENEKNRGFHIKRIVKERLEDFVYINTAKPIAEQIFTAAHELGHIFEVAEKVRIKMGKEDPFTKQCEEYITSRFAAELLMPEEAFKKAFMVYINGMSHVNGKIKLDDLVRIMVMQMNTFMVPYEAVRRRLVETGVVDSVAAKLLATKEKDILRIVDILSKYQNSYLEKETGSKTISGMRELLEAAKRRDDIDEYLVKRIKQDLEIIEIPESENVEVRIGDEDNG